MKGLLLYRKEEAERNRSYADWLLEAAGAVGLKLLPLLAEDFFRRGLAGEEREALFAVNRTRSYQLGLTLELAGLRVFNSSTITLLGNDKLAALARCRQRGIPAAPVLADWQGEKALVSKPVGGHGGEGVCLLRPPYPVFDEHVFQQEYVEDLEGDVRFYLVGNRIVHGVLRRPRGSFMANYSRGASVEGYPYGPTEEALVARWLGELEVDYAGMDFLLKKDGSLLFGELEDMAGSRMLSALGCNDTPELFMAHIKEQLSG